MKRVFYISTLMLKPQQEICVGTSIANGFEQVSLVFISPSVGKASLGVSGLFWPNLADLHSKWLTVGQDNCAF